MINLYNPVALIALVLIPLAYFLYKKTRSEPVRVPSILIWKRAAAHVPVESEAGRKVDVRLLLYLAAILAGILAITRPVIVYPSAAVDAVSGGHDIMQTDDAAPPESEDPRVIHVFGRSDRYLEKALRAIPRTEVRNIWGEQSGAAPAVFVETSCDSLPPGNVAVINPKGKIGPVTIKGRKRVDRIVIERPDEPLLEGVDAERMGVMEVLTGRFPKEMKVIVSAGGMPVIATMPNKGGKLLYVGFDMLGGNFRAYPSFPIFWYNFFGGQSSWDTTFPAARPAPVPEAEEKDLSPIFLLLMLAAIAGIWSVGVRS